MKRIRSYQSGRLRVHVLPFLVWLGALAGVVVLFHQRAQRIEVLGIAQGQVRQVAATCAGRLINVPVQLFQQVRKGDIVAVIDTVLDNEDLQSQLDIAKAEIQRLSAELVHTQEQLLAEAANQQTNWIADRRRFSIDVENARLRRLELKVLIETDRTMLDGLQLNKKISMSQSLSDQNDIPYYELQKTKVGYDAVAKKIEDNKQLLARAEQDLKEAQQRLDEFVQHKLQQPPVHSALEVIRQSITVQEQLIKGLLARRDPLILKSPIDGVVLQLHGRARDVVLRRPGEYVFRREGEVVLPGDPILSIGSMTPTEIVAYANQRQLGQIQEGMSVQLIKNTEPAQIARSQVTYLAPTLERLPEWLWQTPNIPEWGYPMRIEIPPTIKLSPGEIVGIRGL
ncbi:MAG: HlyD family secretion protein [Planctomycetota bacterium]|jgi:multidrug resistance efflux pump